MTETANVAVLAFASLIVSVHVPGACGVTVSCDAVIAEVTIPVQPVTLYGAVPPVIVTG